MNKETNLEHYKEELKGIYGSLHAYPLAMINEIKNRLDGNIKHGHETGNELFTDDILDWMAQPYKEPVLDNVEKKYLGAVIKPFRNRIKYIYLATYVEDYYQIRIVLKSNIFINTNYVSIANLPPFEKGTMYKGMVIDRHYSLKELGL